MEKPEKVSMALVIDTALESLQELLMTDAGLRQKDREAMLAQIAALESVKSLHQELNK